MICVLERTKGSWIYLGKTSFGTKDRKQSWLGKNWARESNISGGKRDDMGKIYLVFFWPSKVLNFLMLHFPNNLLLQSLTVPHWLFCSSLCRTGWSQTQENQPFSVFRIPGIEACDPLSWIKFLMKILENIFLILKLWHLISKGELI